MSQCRHLIQSRSWRFLSRKSTIRPTSRISLQPLHYQPTYLPTYPPTHLQNCHVTWPIFYTNTRWPTHYQPTYLLTHLPAHLPTYKIPLSNSFIFQIPDTTCCPLLSPHTITLLCVDRWAGGPGGAVVINGLSFWCIITFVRGGSRHFFGISIIWPVSGTPSISIFRLVFLYHKLWREHLEDLAGTLFLKNSAGIPFFPQTSYEYQKMGLIKMGLRAIFLPLLRKLLAKSSCLHPPHHGVRWLP